MIGDAIVSCHQIKEEHFHRKQQEQQLKQQYVEEWIKIKNKQLKLKKREKRQKKLVEDKKKQAKKQHAQLGNLYNSPNSFQGMVEAIDA